MTGKHEQLNRALALKEALADDAAELSTEEAWEEVRGRGEDPEAVAQMMRGAAMALVTRVRKERLTQAREQLRVKPINQTVVQRSAAAIREAITRLASEAESVAGMKIAVAHRNGRDQSDEDVQSLWQDLVDLGAVSDDDLAR